MEVFIIFGCMFVLWAMYAYHRQQRDRGQEGVPYLGPLFDSIAGQNNYDKTVIITTNEDSKFAVPLKKRAASHSKSKNTADHHPPAQNFNSTSSFGTFAAESPATETAKQLYKRPESMYGISDHTAIETNNDGQKDEHKIKRLLSHNRHAQAAHN